MQKRTIRPFRIIIPIVLFVIMFVGLPIWYVYAQCTPDQNFAAGSFFKTIKGALAFLAKPIVALAGGDGTCQSPPVGIYLTTNTGRDPDYGCYGSGGDTCIHYKTLAKWDATQARNGIRIYIDTKGAPSAPYGISWFQVETAAKDAFKQWDDRSDNLKFEVGGIGPNGCSSQNNNGDYSCIGFSNTEDLAYTDVHTSILSGKIYEADMTIDSDLWAAGIPFDWVLNIPPGCVQSFDLLSIMTHEAGHYLSLDDLSLDGERLLTMYVHHDNYVCQTYKRDLGWGDVLGVRDLYGL